MTEMLVAAEHGTRRRAAIAVFEAGWTGSPDRSLLVDCATWLVVAANPAARNELLDRHGIDLVGLNVAALVNQEHDMVASRERWRSDTAADVTVRPHAYDHERYVRIATWPMRGFDGDFLIVVARDIDLGFRSAFETAQPLFEVSNNLVTVASSDRIVYSNPRFLTQFGTINSIDALFAQLVPVGGQTVVGALDRARAGLPATPFEVRIDVGGVPQARAEVAIAPAPTLAEAGVLVVIVPLGAEAVELPESLSAREREVVALMLRGLRIPSIASELHLSPHTVRNHLRTIFAKCDVASQRELIDRLRDGSLVE